MDGLNCLPPNARRLKGLANILKRYEDKLPPTIPSAGPERAAAVQQAKRLLIVTMVYQFHHDLFRRWYHDPTFYRYIETWCFEPVSTRRSDEERFMSVFDRLSPTVHPALETESLRSPAVPAGGSTYRTTTAHPDPTNAAVFWPQALIVSLGINHNPDSFRDLLYHESSQGIAVAGAQSVHS